MSPDYVSAAQEVVAVYLDTYGEGITAVYVAGSVHCGEAVLGVSDLDAHAFGDVPASPKLREALFERASRRLNPWPLASGSVGPPHPLTWLEGARPDAPEILRAQYPFYAFRLHYDATRVYGRDLLAGLPVPVPDAAFARAYIEDPAETVRLALMDQGHPEFPLPINPLARLRKLARLAVLCGGCVLIARGRFRSLKGADVLPGIESYAPHWSAFLRDTARCYVRVEPDAPAYEPYMRSLGEFAQWASLDIEAANSP